MISIVFITLAQDIRAIHKAVYNLKKAVMGLVALLDGLVIKLSTLMTEMPVKCSKSLSVPRKVLLPVPPCNLGVLEGGNFSTVFLRQ